MLTQKFCDVPQGSTLGPSLYIDYTAPPVGDIFRKHHIDFHIYADDTQAYLEFSVGEEEQARKQLELCLEEVKMWMTSNWLQLNASKTEFIVFSHEQYGPDVNVGSINIGNSSVSASKHVKSIGAYLDSGMTMQKQISATCRSCWFHLYQIGKIRKYLNEDQAKSLIHAHVTSRLDQNNSLLIGVPKTKLKCLQAVQNAAARLIVGLKKRDHITPTLKALHWLPVEKRILYKILLLTFKTVNGKGPEYLKELLVEYVPARSLRSAKEKKLCIPKSHYAHTAQRAFGVRAPVEWNRLPCKLRNTETVDCFKRHLKAYLFDQAYSM